MYTKEELLDRINDLHEELYRSVKIRPSAQERITEILKEAVAILAGAEISVIALNEAATKISLARITLNQVSGQNSRWVFPLAALITVWSFGFLACSGAAIFFYQLYPQLQSDSLPKVLFGAVAWGVGGASLHGLVELHRRFARQEFDTRRSFWYLSHPVIGGGLGAIVFLFALGGLLVTGQTDVLPASDNANGGFNASAVLFLAAIVGFEQPHVVSYISNTTRRIFGVQEQTVTEGG